jgi:hypothetical protein
MVIANLLIRIPSFSNYRLILKDLNPELLPVGIVLEHRDRIMKQCPNIYKTEVVNTHKYAWQELAQGDPVNCPLHLEFRELRERLERVVGIGDGIGLYCAN